MEAVGEREGSLQITFFARDPVSQSLKNDGTERLNLTRAYM
jgi:hypothetical protein